MFCCSLGHRHLPLSLSLSLPLSLSLSLSSPPPPSPPLLSSPDIALSSRTVETLRLLSTRRQLDPPASPPSYRAIRLVLPPPCLVCTTSVEIDR
ncbi:hypothetical protein EV126DRAFT_4115 [Verticillium dahliae]|nr:hypothetical protein EV126DRAFT_4115 [Verticillium dahliae]